MRHLTILAIAAALVTACAAGAADPTADPEGLAGREFWSTAVQGHVLVLDTRVRLAFDADGTLGAGAGCNSMGGRWSLDGTTLRAAISQMTEMGCPDPRMAQDDWLIDWLAGELTASLDGDDLVLTGAGVTMALLDREVADPDQPTAGTTWVLDGLQLGAGDEGTVSSVPAGVRATLRIEGDQLAVDTGCNTGTASATTDGDTLTIGPLGLTKRGCEPGAAEVERFMTGILQGAVTLEVDGQTLRVTGPGAALLFRAD